jgi:hypothetical protein
MTEHLLYEGDVTVDYLTTLMRMWIAGFL